MRRLIVVAAALLAFGSGPALAVFGGTVLAAADPIAKSTAAILYRDATGTHLCTAVALGPRLLLTAAHCTDGQRSDMRVIFANTLVNVGSDRLRAVTAVSRPQATSEAKGKFAYNNPDDIALVQTDSPAPAGTSFARLAVETATGAARIAGYGATSDLRNPGLGKTQRGFDQLLRSASVILTASGPALLTVDQGKGSGVCTGDSGGPAFVAGAKPLTVAGVLIGVSAPRNATDFCRGKAWYASVPHWHDWLVTTAAKLGQKL